MWVVDSTPVECGRSRETAQRSDLAGWAEYGYCASHSRFFWGLRLHLVCTLSGLPVAFALAGAKADEREVLLGMFEAALADADLELLRPARKGEKPRPGHRYFKPFRQVIESINNTLMTQLDLEHHGGRTIAGIASRVLQRILALTAAIWHNDQLGQPTLRSLTALRSLNLGITHLGGNAQNQCRPLSATTAQCGCSGSAATAVQFQREVQGDPGPDMPIG